MLLAIDIGNSNISAGVFGKGEEPLFCFSLSAKEARSADEYQHLILAALQEKGVQAGEIRDGAIASVVPMLTAPFEQALEAICGRRPLVLGAGVKTGIHIRTDAPFEVGADIIANAAAAPCERGAIIADFGTATTIFAVSKQRELLGGAILPGIASSMESLRAQTAQLPSVAPIAKGEPLGKNTAECIASGVLMGQAFAVDEFARRYGEILGGEPMLLATGGLAPMVLPHCRLRFIQDQYLTLKGLRLIYEKTRKIAIS